MPKDAKIINLTLGNEARLRQFGAIFANIISYGDIILLEGDLGAGKTTLARKIIRSLLNDETMEVPSPTFALVQPYQSKQYNILHCDFYRIINSLEIEELGLFEDEKSILLIEWGQNAPQIAAITNWKITLLMNEKEGAREIIITHYNENAKLEKLAKNLQQLKE